MPGILSDMAEALMLAILLPTAWSYTLLYMSSAHWWAFGLHKAALSLLLIIFLTGWYVWRWKQFWQAGRMQQWLHWHKLEFGVLLILWIVGSLIITVATIAVIIIGMQTDHSGFGTLMLILVVVYGSLTYLPALLILLHVPIVSFLLRRNHPSMPLWRALRLCMLAATGWSLPIILLMIVWGAMKGFFLWQAVLNNA